jgi:hypothetical protein
MQNPVKNVPVLVPPGQIPVVRQPASATVLFMKKFLALALLVALCAVPSFAAHHGKHKKAVHHAHVAKHHKTHRAA